MDLEDKIVKLFDKFDCLSKELKEVKEENIQLKGRIKTLESKLQKKNSSNSSIPPSKDDNRVKRNQSLRKSTGNKTGGQKGSKGTTLKMHDTVDYIIDHKVEFCSCCGEKLEDTQVYIGKRQVIDIPPIEAVVTEHRIYSVVCQCGNGNVSNYPKEAKSPISYGKKIESLIAYLSAGQYMPMNRMAEFFDQMFNIKLSQGTISNKLLKFAERCLPLHNEIKRRISCCRVVGGDETGCVINGKKGWMWTWQSKELTYISATDNRGYKSVLDHFPNGLPNAILVSDCWAAQLKTPTFLKQICLAHIQRELKYFIQSCKNKWSKRFLKLIYKALKLKKEILKNSTINHHDRIAKIQLESEKLLGQKAKGPKKFQTLKNRLSKHSNSLWVFLDYLDVPPDNNGSERAIRNVKVKQKISGQFRSEKGAQQFAIIRSIYDTIRKNMGKPLDVFSLITSNPNFQVYLPE